MTATKRYQVFVSSTFADLKEERQEVIQALLELDCIPSGMELFPAADESQWNLIQKVIDDCDYYLVIVAGRYGSIAEDGLSYTEKEYRYAADKNKPTIAFLHEDPSSIASGKSEQEPESKKKLAAFRGRCEKKMCKFWSSPADLGGKVSRSLVQLIKSNPSVGWVRGDAALDEGTATTINRLRGENDSLRSQLDRIRKEPPKGAELLAQGQDIFDIHFSYHAGVAGHKCGSLTMTWDEIFGILSPHMIREASDYSLRSTLLEVVLNRSTVKRDYGLNAKVDSVSFHNIMVQLRALGFVSPSEEKRSVKDRGTTYWSLTPYGDDYMNRLLAIPKKDQAAI